MFAHYCYCRGLFVSCNLQAVWERGGEDRRDDCRPWKGLEAISHMKAGIMGPLSACNLIDNMLAGDG